MAKDIQMVMSAPPLNWNTRETLFAMHETTCNAALRTMKKKNQDYASTDNPYVNFMASTIYGLHPALGLLIRVTDKLQRINSFIVNGTLAVENEPVEDAIEDVINYMILLKGLITYLEQEKSSKTKL